MSARVTVLDLGIFRRGQFLHSDTISSAISKVKLDLSSDSGTTLLYIWINFVILVVDDSAVAMFGLCSFSSTTSYRARGFKFISRCIR